VELHGGTIAAHSAGAGQGSEFVIRLAALDAAAQPALSGASGGRDVAAATGLRVLLVDDNVDAAEVLAEGLRTFGHEVAVAHDGDGALAIAPAFQPDVALLDIGLPVMDGYALAAKLREQLQPRPPRLFAVTGYGQERDRTKSRDAGFEVHLVKPVDLDAVVALFAPAGGDGDAS
jgi:CheY-like chemotaxis protein